MNDLHRREIGNRVPGPPLPSSAPIVIVGGGIVGLSTAYFLARRGLRSVVLEQEESLGTRTTAMSAHCIRAQFSEPDNIEMMAESLAFYESFGAHCVAPDGNGYDIGLQQQGYLFASTDPVDAEGFEARVAIQRSCGLDDVEVLTGSDVRDRYPWLSPDIAVGTFRRRDGWIDSARAVEGFAKASGADIYTGVQITGIETDGSGVTGVATDRGFVASDCVVLAAGPCSRDLCPEPLPIVLWRRHRVIVKPIEDIPQTGPVTIDANTGSHWRPHLGGALVAWARPETDSPAQWPVPTDPDFPDQVLRGPDGIGRLSPFWFDLASRLGADDLTLTAGQYTVTPDHRPLIGPAVQTGGLFLNTGYSGHGIMGCPAGSRILADIMAGNQTSNPFAPDRFLRGSLAPDLEQVII